MGRHRKSPRISRKSATAVAGGASTVAAALFGISTLGALTPPDTTTAFQALPTPTPAGEGIFPAKPTTSQPIATAKSLIPEDLGTSLTTSTSPPTRAVIQPAKPSATAQAPKKTTVVPVPKAAPVKPPVAPAGKTCGTSGFSGVKPHVAQVGYALQKLFGIGTILGVAGRAGTSDHPSGLALDFMVYNDRVKGDALAAYVLANKKSLSVSYVIWRQRINMGSGWQPMEDRGSVTANHFDHVHVSFTAAPTGAAPTC